MSRLEIYLSPPDVGADERALLLDAFDSNWIAPLGPHVDAFESELAAVSGRAHALATSSGTAALHLALDCADVRAGDSVLCSTLTFVASANPIRYVGARPVFVDCDRASWCIDPDRFEEAVERYAPRAAIVVDLYGQCADYDRIGEIAASAGVTLIEDAAEALGASIGGKPAGAFGRLGVFSFNGNKIITTSGGGMLVGDDADDLGRARHLATQAREPTLHYEHRDVGYNYRMSNLLAAVGRGQLRGLEAKVTRRRQIFARYRDGLGGRAGVQMMPEPDGSRSSRWLTCLTVQSTARRDAIIDRLADAGIEARPVWKPMHLQPLYADADRVGGDVAADLFARGLCLPSGSSLRDEQVDRIIELVAQALDAGGVA